MIINKIKEFKVHGSISYGLFIICIVTGIILAISYDVEKPYESIAYGIMLNKAFSLFRSLHYWSATLFLLSLVYHTIYFIWNDTIQKYKIGIWLRLILSIAVGFFVMFSGFLLRGDGESAQAGLILRNLFEAIPLIGGFLANITLGTGESLQLVYVHHIATATIFLWLITIEHGKMLQPRLSFYVVSICLTLAFAVILIPGIHDPLNLVMKSPWYFIGLQELLHWLGRPGLSWFLVIALFFGLLKLRTLQGRALKIMKWVLLVFLGIYIVLSIIGFFFRDANWNFSAPGSGSNEINFGFRTGLDLYSSNEYSFNKDNIPIVRGRPESCVACHSEMEEWSQSHSIEALGCSSCHLGDNLSIDKDDAHTGMILIPGNLANAEKSCGSNDCHPSITRRISSSLMATMSGIISVDRHIFGEAASLDNHFNVKDLAHTNADVHLRNLCASCHLQQEKTDYGPIDELSRGGGCNACHLQYTQKALAELVNYINDSTFQTKIHPSLSLKTGDDHCFGCHSRSGRISTNYQGWIETMMKPEQVTNDSTFRVLMDDRVFEKMPADVHHTCGMECIDCHSSYELMGDGNKYYHKEDQVKIECEDCHTNKYSSIAFEELDIEARKIAVLRKLDQPGRKYLKTRNAGQALINAYLIHKNKAVLRPKNGDTILQLKPPSPLCGKDIPGHDRIACKSCHTAWAAQCINCHTEYVHDKPSWDNVEQKEVKGGWKESFTHIYSEPPTLGVMEKDGRSVVDTYIPGMVMTIGPYMDKKKTTFHRYYSPAFTHTISKKSRTCQSCHNDPVALGYGKGQLQYVVNDKKASWRFIPEFENSAYDNFPVDAWIPFGRESQTSKVTRNGHRPFNKEEQKRILLVGACLSCHDEKEKRLTKVFFDFKNYRKYLSKRCIISTQ